MKTILLFFMAIYCPCLLAQKVVATCGGTLGNASGSISFTIGEGVAQTLSKGDKTLTQGFHQTIISVKAITKLIELGFSITAFPNPTSDVVKLIVSNRNVTGLQYLLFDLSGKLIYHEKLESDETSIPFQYLHSGFYILKVQDEVQELKSFKIIKQKE